MIQNLNQNANAKVNLSLKMNLLGNANGNVSEFGVGRLMLLGRRIAWSWGKARGG